METFSALLAICGGLPRWPVNSPHKGQWRGALLFSLISAWMNDWVNNREAGHFRRRDAHYDVTVMVPSCLLDTHNNLIFLYYSGSPKHCVTWTSSCSFGNFCYFTSQSPNADTWLFGHREQRQATCRSRWALQRLVWTRQVRVLNKAVPTRQFRNVDGTLNRGCAKKSIYIHNLLWYAHPKHRCENLKV